MAVYCLMARQTGDFKITGTIDCITFYEMQGQYYARMKSSLTGKRFWKDKAFEGSRKSCSRLGRGSILASMAYRSIDKEKRKYALFCFLKREAIQLLKKGMDEVIVANALQQYLKRKGCKKEIKNQNEQTSSQKKITVIKSNPSLFTLPMPCMLKEKEKRIKRRRRYPRLLKETAKGRWLCRFGYFGENSPGVP